eukprot:scaffold7802_cov71-Cyclotella_meneghiniana.AAC.11
MRTCINLQTDGDLLESELNEIYVAAATSNKDTINIDQFVSVYKGIDNLFEDDEDESELSTSIASPVDTEGTFATNESQLQSSFTQLAQNNQVSKSTLRQWDDVRSLIDDESILGIDEFDDLWDKAVGDASDCMDYKAFVAFNEALDELFVLEDEEVEAMLESGEGEQYTMVQDGADTASTPRQPKPIITETDLPPAVLFSQLANENYLVLKEDLSRWGEMCDMLSEGDLTTIELNELWNEIDKAPGTKDALDEEGFLKLCEKIDELFEDEDEEVEQSNDDTSANSGAQDLKEELLEFIQDLGKLSEEEGRQPCGLDCTELEQERVLEIVGELEQEPYNLVAQGGESNTVPKEVRKEDLVGNWDLIYSSSSTMKYNEGLSGLAGGLTRFGGVQQRLTATKYLSDVEYVEQVVGKLGGNSFEVIVTGDWDLRTEVSLFTGKPSNVLSVTPDSVKYGPRSDKADHWKSLGPMNLLEMQIVANSPVNRFV